MYDIYIDKMLVPVAPKKIDLKIKNKNKSMTLINDGEINVLKKAGLTEISFDLLLPNVKYPLAQYKDGFKTAKYYLSVLENLKIKQEPFKFKIIRKLPNGKMIFDTNMRVSLEDYTIVDDAKEGFDNIVNVTLKQYKVYGTKTCNIKFANTKPKIKKPKPPRQKKRSPKPKNKNKTYVVRSGDCLWNISRKFYGNGKYWRKIYNANRKTIGGNPNLIYPGQRYTIPM